jgi:hypothetical protein
MDADKMIVTQYNHLTTEELIRLALSKEDKGELEKELLARLIKETKRGGGPNYGE